MIIAEELRCLVHDSRLVEAYAIAVPQAIHFASEGQRKLRRVEVMGGGVISNERYCGVQYLGAELFFTRENGEKLRYGYRTECAWKDRILAMKSLDTSTKLENLGKK